MGNDERMTPEDELELKQYSLYINGSFRQGASGETLPSVNPTTGEPWARIACARDEDVNAAVSAAAAAFDSEAWRGFSAAQRGRLLLRLGDQIAVEAERLAECETRDNGKLYREMIAQLQMIPEWLFYYGGLADKIEGRVKPLDNPQMLNYTLREPVGVVAVIKPWNSPILLTLQAVGPALAAGNTVVIKPSEDASVSVLELMRLFDDAGFPPGVVNVVTGDAEVGRRVVEHDGVRKVAFTGGTKTGREIGAVAGRRLAPVILELGGKSANIVFGDADLDAAEAGVLAGIYAAGGQSCVAGSRVLVEEDVFDELVGRLSERAARIRVGDPMDDQTEMGPIGTKRQLEKIESYVEMVQRDGGLIRAGGDRVRIPELPGGFFYGPTLVTGLGKESVVLQEEIFGPVATVSAFSSEQEAIALGNASRYGLAAGVWTRDVKRAHRVAERLEAGTIWINTYRAFACSSPSGGCKDSGFGKENGIEGMEEYFQTKSVWCDLGEEIQDPFIIKV